MRIPGFPGAHLTYCLNIHPGETWADNLAAIRQHARQVKERVSPREPFGLGLRVSRRAVETLADPAAVEAFRRMLAESGLYAFTINGFPYGAFHGTVVKADVYRPDWRQPERLDYTCRLGEFLAAVLPEDLPGSISTVPVSYGEWMREDRDYEAAVGHLAACAAAFHALRNRTGREIHLGLEPEPDCALETTEQTVEFFERRLRPAGTAWLRANRGCSAREADDMLRRHIGVCFDTCHVSVQFERPADSLAAMVRHGIRISKVQISAALKARMEADGARHLEAFVDPVYLHQAKSRDAAGHKASYPDMTREFLAGWTNTGDARDCRIHFHVPLYISEYDGIASTAGDLTPAFFREAAGAGVRHFEIETYTFPVLPPALRRQAVEESIAGEYAWALDQFRQAATRPAGGI